MTLRGRWPVWLWLAGLLIGAVIIGRTPLASDMSAFLPRSANPGQQILVDQLREGAVSRLLLVGVSGGEPATLAGLSKALAARLRAFPEIVLVNNGEESGLARERDYFWRNRYFLSAALTPGHFSAEALRTALMQDLRRLGGGTGLLVKAMLPADPTGEMLNLLDRLSGEQRPALREGVWFAPDGGRALLMIQTRPAGFDIDAQEALLGKIEGAFNALRRQTPDAAQARLVATGPPVFAIQSRAQIKGDATRLSIIATSLVALILLVSYRSVRVLALGLFPVASGALAGFCAVSLGFGFVHGITLGFGVTLIGEAVDYAVYLFSQTAPASPPKITLRRIWPTLRLGLLTSVFGFSAMLLSGFPGFVQLGLFTIVGLIVAASVTRWVLPVLLPPDFAGARASALGPWLRRAVTHVQKARLGLAALLAAAMLLLTFHPGGFWEDELSSMNPVPLSAQKLDQTLRREMGAPDVRYMILAKGADDEEALAASEALGAALAPLVTAGALSGFDAPHLSLPSHAAQLARQAAIPDETALRENMAQALTGLPFKPDLFQPFLAAAAEARNAHPLDRADLAGTSLALKLDSQLLERPSGAIALLSLRGVHDPAAIESALRGRPGVTFLDLKGESDRLLSGYLREAKTLAVLGSLAIALLLAVSLRSAARMGVVLSPLAAAVIVTAALLTLGGQQLSVFNLFGLLLVVAVGSNYCLFFEGARAQRRLDERIVASVVLANLCTVIGFGVLSFSGVPVLHGIGMTVAVGTFLSLIFAMGLTAPDERDGVERGPGGGVNG